MSWCGVFALKLAQLQKTTGVSLNAVCGETGAVRCKMALMAFAEKYRGRLSASLLLSPLAKFRPGSEPTPTVVYMSNVLDPIFMSEQEFAELRKNFSDRRPLHVLPAEPPEFHHLL